MFVLPLIVIIFYVGGWMKMVSIPPAAVKQELGLQSLMTLAL